MMTSTRVNITLSSDVAARFSPSGYPSLFSRDGRGPVSLGSRFFDLGCGGVFAMRRITASRRRAISSSIGGVSSTRRLSHGTTFPSIPMISDAFTDNSW